MTKSSLINSLLEAGILPPELAAQLKAAAHEPCGCLTCHLQAKYDRLARIGSTRVDELKDLYTNIQVASVMGENCQNIANQVDPAATLRLAEVARETHPAMGEALEALASCVETLRSLAGTIMEEARRNAAAPKPAAPPEPTMESRVAEAAGKVDLN